MCVTLLYTPSAFIKMPFLLCALCDTFTCHGVMSDFVSWCRHLLVPSFFMK